MTIFGTIVSITSCSKKDTVTPPLSSTVKIVGKWNIYRTVTKQWDLSGNLIVNDVEMGEPGDSVVFKPNNIMITYTRGIGDDTMAWQSPNDSTLIVDGENYKISTLTTSLFTFGMKEVFGGFRLEAMVELKR